MIDFFIRNISIIKNSLISLCIFFGFFLIRKNANLEAKTKILEENLKDVHNREEKIISNQSQQATVAVQPIASRDDIHKWMLDLSSPHNK